MKRILILNLAIVCTCLWLTPDIHAQRGGRRGGGQPAFGTGYGGTARTGYGGGFGTGYGGGFRTGYGGGYRTGYGGTMNTGWGGRPYSAGGYGLGQAGTGRGLGTFNQAGTGFAPGAAGSLTAGRVGYPGSLRTGAVGTYHRTNDDLIGQGDQFRNRFQNYDLFNRAWYNRYPNAWYPVGWGGGATWLYPTWDSLAAFTSYPETMMYYDYGSSVVYQGDQVYINGDSVGSQEQYAHQASQIAEAGKNAKVSKDDTWLSLGVFSILDADDTDTKYVVQLAINKLGVLRGNLVNTDTSETSPIYGSVGTKSERAAWIAGDAKTPVYEVGIANLTKNETTMLLHISKGNTRQYTLVRLKQPDDAK